MLSREMTIVRPSRGKPSIHHYAEHTADVHAAIDAHGWNDISKLAAFLRKKGYQVEVRDFIAREPESRLCSVVLH